jgi:amidophosphoribosyltransferase
MPSRSELVAHGRDTQSIASAIGADLVVFQTLPDLIASVRQFNPDITSFDCSVFTGQYVTGGVDDKYLQHLENLREDNMRGRVGGVRALEGGGGVRVNGVNGVKEEGREVTVGASSPTSGTDDTVGLYNSWNVSS